MQRQGGHRLSNQKAGSRKTRIQCREKGGGSRGLTTFFLVAFLIALECVFQLTFESFFPSVNSWHGIDHVEVQARSLPGERRESCERPHLRGRNGTGRASQEVETERVICFFCTGFRIASLDSVKLVRRGESWREPGLLQGQAQAGMPREGGGRRSRRKKIRRRRKRRCRWWWRSRG